jgi:PAS domain S-box-containing protein
LFWRKEKGGDEHRNPLSMEPLMLLRYCVAVLAVGLALLSQLLLSPFILQQTPFLLVSAAVVVAAWYGGLGSGLLATFLAAPLTDYYLLPPIHSLSSPGLQGLPVGVFVIEGVVVSSLIAALRSARQRAEASTLEAHRHQQNLRRSEERFRLLVEGIIDYAIFMLDPMGRVATWNESAERIQGYKAEEILGEHFSRFYTQEDVSRGHPEEQLRVATTAGRYEGEGWQVSKNGSHFWASILITALKDEAGKPARFCQGDPGHHRAETGRGGGESERGALSDRCRTGGREHLPGRRRDQTHRQGERRHAAIARLHLGGNQIDDSLRCCCS